MLPLWIMLPWGIALMFWNGLGLGWWTEGIGPAVCYIMGFMTGVALIVLSFV